MTAQIALVLDIESKEWLGELPSTCHQVALQYLNDEGEWQPPIEKTLAKNKAESVEAMEKILQRGGPFKYKQYRLIPAADNSNNEENEMKKMNKASKSPKTPKKKKPAAELVAGRWREGSELAKMFTLLSDGVARTQAEIQKVVQASKPDNIFGGKFAALSQWGKTSGACTVTKVGDGRIQLLLSGSKVKPATAEKVTKPAAKAKAATKPAAKAKAATDGVSIEA